VSETSLLSSGHHELWSCHGPAHSCGTLPRINPSTQPPTSAHLQPMRSLMPELSNTLRA